MSDIAPAPHRDPGPHNEGAPPGAASHGRAAPHNEAVATNREDLDTGGFNKKEHPGTFGNQGNDGSALDAAHAAFRRWLGPEFDVMALDIVLAAAAQERLSGDPAWLLVVSGSGNAKTEMVSALAGAGALVTSTIASEGALLSATSRKDTASDATGGLLRKMGAPGQTGLLVIKDFTSIISQSREMRSAVLAALRETYDGRWERNVGTDGGKTLTWEGRLVVIGAVTTAYDSAHAVIASMGDRFALVRVDSNLARMASGRQSLANVGHESQMRAELVAQVGALMSHVDTVGAVLDEAFAEELLAAANLVTLSRTAVERDFKGDVVDGHMPEVPTRFAKMLAQIARGGLALGMSRDRALAIALRVAHDSAPPLRLAVLADVLAYPGSTTSEVARRVQKPRTTVDRSLQELHVLGLIEIAAGMGQGWVYNIAAGVDEAALSRLVAVPVGPLGSSPASPDLAVGGPRDLNFPNASNDISGNGPTDPTGSVPPDWQDDPDWQGLGVGPTTRPGNVSARASTAAVVSRPPATPARIGQAGRWLLAFLAEHGAMPRADILEAALAAGQSYSSVKRAQRSLPVRSLELTGQDEEGRPFRRAVWALSPDDASPCASCGTRGGTLALEGLIALVCDDCRTAVA
jgi:hypothetical protein